MVKSVQHGLLYAVVCPSTLALWVTVRQQHTHTHTHTCVLSSAAMSEQNAGKKRKEALLRLLIAFLLSEQWPTFSPGKKKACAADCENLWGLGGREKGRKVKAKNERNRKTTYRKKFIGQARKQSKKGGCCRVVSELTVKPQWPNFFWTRQATIRRVTQVFNFLCGFL